MLHENGSGSTPLRYFRKKALEYVQSASFKSSVVNAIDGSEIRISKSGIREALSHGSGPGKIQAVAAIPGMLERAVPISSAPHAHGRPETRHIYAAELNISGKKFIVGLVVREDVNGRKFYDHEMTNLEAVSPDQEAASHGAKLGSSKPPQGPGCVDIHFNQIAMAARCRKERNDVANVSYLLETLRNCLSLLNMRSMTFLSLQIERSCSRFVFRRLRGGITASVPVASMASIMACESYPLSATI